jgi:hypothetical protein
VAATCRSGQIGIPGGIGGIADLVHADSRDVPQP